MRNFYFTGDSKDLIENAGELAEDLLIKDHGYYKEVEPDDPAYEGRTEIVDGKHCVYTPFDWWPHITIVTLLLEIKGLLEKLNERENS